MKKEKNISDTHKSYYFIKTFSSFSSSSSICPDDNEKPEKDVSLFFITFK